MKKYRNYVNFRKILKYFLNKMNYGRICGNFSGTNNWIYNLIIFLTELLNKGLLTYFIKEIA